MAAVQQVIYTVEQIPMSGREWVDLFETGFTPR
jgi:hypothetical protein